MFLEKLETVGFKSFAERTKIQFVPGITTIVGPNGSGKSNIIDAIRWVLGEQSARSLRGQRMEDIIFQGSDTRAPLNFAEVSLTLNNKDRILPIDYHEVNVMRRVYRSGDSEFLINNQPCRLKDIVDLFTDTGLGRESFSIIGQGKIDTILSTKASERRAVFEEAAGVMRYKQRKEEATYKLEETKLNLSRVEDIIYEINQQLKPLYEQAKTAKRYEQLNEKLTSKEISLLITEIDQLHKEWTDLLQTIEKQEIHELAKQNTIRQLDANIEQIRGKIDQSEHKLNTLHEQLLSVTEELEQTEGQKKVYIEQQKHRAENKHNLQEEQKVLTKQLEQLEKTIATEEEKYKHIDEELLQINEQTDNLEQKLHKDGDQLKLDIENLKANYIEYLNKQAVIQNELQFITKQLEQREQSLERRKQERNKLLEERDSLKKDLNKKGELMESLQADIALLQSEVRQIEKAHTNEQQGIKANERKLYELKDEYTKYKTRQETLLEMKESFQGFAQGVKAVLQAKKQGELSTPSIIGPVIDLIDVPSKYMVAIDTILRAQAQYIVVEDDQTARKVIEWLKRGRRGRVTFLPLQSIIPRYLPARILHTIQGMTGFIGIASSLVQVENTYKRVVDHLMGNVIVTETLKDANAIAARTNRSFRIVTLEGDVVFPGGSISGGSQRGRHHSLFTREKQLQQINQSLRSLQEQITSIQKEQKQLQTKFNRSSYSKEERTERLIKKQEKYETIYSRYREGHIKLNSLTDQLEVFNYELSEIKDEMDEYTTEKTTQKNRLKLIEEKIVSTNENIKEKTTYMQRLEQNREAYHEQLHKLQVSAAEHRERRRHFLENITTYKTEYEQTNVKLQNVTKELAMIAKVEKNNIQLSTIEYNLKNLRKKQQKIREDIKQLQQIRNSNIQEVSDLEGELKAQRQLFDQFSVRLQEEKVKAGKLDVQLENRLNRLQSEYAMTYERAQTLYNKVKHPEEMREEVARLKQKISALGTVNLGAIDEYERLNSRFTFLTEQQKDLLEAKETLYEAIREMDEEMIIRFKETFESIEEAFAIVFKQLFGGGRAKLKLTDPDNYLETGIEIIAQPPGKQLKTLQLLSGGERALTAIALLFSILRARPVPFVILDEVDAALDEANVERFANYLKSFSEEGQFIVISHRKGTMERADVLYGVTMQESGVSRFVSVRLEETDQIVQTT